MSVFALCVRQKMNRRYIDILYTKRVSKFQLQDVSGQATQELLSGAIAKSIKINTDYLII